MLFHVVQSHAQNPTICKIVIDAAWVSTIVSMTSFPSASRTTTTVVAWCPSIPIYLSHFI